MKKKWAKWTLSDIKYDQKILYWYEKFGYNFYYYYIKIRDFWVNKSSLVHFVYETNTQCTLKCKECHSYMPYFKSHYMVDFDTFKKEIDKLLKSVDLICSFRLQGGETLLVKDLAKIIEYACSKKQIQHIQVISNGTIIPSEDLLKAMKNPKVLFSLSDYSCNEAIKNRLKYDEILKLCQLNGVNAKHWLTKPGEKWVARNVIKNCKLPTNKDISNKNLSSCWCFAFPKAIILFMGKLYICAPEVFYHFNVPDFYIEDIELIDVLNLKTKKLTKAIKTLVKKRVFNLCTRCNAYENRDVKSTPGVQIDD